MAVNTAPQKIWKLGLLNWSLLGLIFLFLVIAFWGGLQELFHRWDNQDEYNHGYMIPLATLYFIWQKKTQLQQTRFTPSWSGLVIVLLALAIAIIGEISALYILIHYSFIIILFGTAWTMMGWPAVKLVTIPIFLLVFAIPLPYFLEAQLSANLQLLSSKLGVSIIRWCRIPVYLSGNVIDLGSYRLQVVEACSGLRYLFPLMGLGFICAYLFDTVFWKRAVVFLSTIPITIFMNSFRIGMIGILVDNYGIEMAEGFLHDFEGWIIFMACMIILILQMILLARIGKDSRPFSEVFGSVFPDAPNPDDEVVQRDFAKPCLAILVLILGSAYFINALDQRNEMIPERNLFVDFPQQLADWQGQHHNLEPYVINALKLTDYVMADYVDGNKMPVNFYAAYYASQRKGESPHSPQVCIPGGGWEISTIKRINWNGLPFNRIIIKKDNAKQLVYYWFQQRGRMVANEYLMKWYLFKDALLMNRTDGALVRLTTMIHPTEEEADADNRLRSFAADVIPLLPKYLPE